MCAHPRAQVVKRVTGRGGVSLRCIWIGTAHLDRLLTYPRVRNLSGCWLPIRVVVSYAGSVSRSAAEGHRNVVLGASTGDDILAWD